MTLKPIPAIAMFCAMTSPSHGVVFTDVEVSRERVRTQTGEGVFGNEEERFNSMFQQFANPCPIDHHPDDVFQLILPEGLDQIDYGQVRNDPDREERDGELERSGPSPEGAYRANIDGERVTVELPDYPDAAPELSTAASDWTDGALVFNARQPYTLQVAELPELLNGDTFLSLDATSRTISHTFETEPMFTIPAGTFEPGDVISGHLLFEEAIFDFDDEYQALGFSSLRLEFQMRAVPEPSAAGLAIAALLARLLRRRR